jgi:hypothetical protein
MAAVPLPAARLAASIFFLTLILAAVPAHAQPPVSADRPLSPLGAVFDTQVPLELLTDLPGNGSVLSLLGTLLPELVSDRVDTGGLSASDASRLGAHGSSWTQTRFRFGNVDVTDPDGSGTPLLIPGLFEWQTVSVSTGLMPVSENAPGLSLQFTPRRPAAAWMREVSGSVAPSAFAAGSIDREPPSIQRMDSWLTVTGLASGPIVPDRIGLLVSGTATRSSRYDRAQRDAATAEHTTAFGHLLLTPTPQDEATITVAAQRAHFPAPSLLTVLPQGSEVDHSALAHASWQRRNGARSLDLFGGFSWRRRASEAIVSEPTVIERMLDGPVPELLYPGPGTSPVGSTRRFDGGARFHAAPFITSRIQHTVAIGAELTGARAEVGEAVDALIGELVGGAPARVWFLEGWSAPSVWTTTSFAAYASDRLEFSPRLLVDAGARLERVNGSARDAAGDISWFDLYPRAGVRWQPTASDRVVIFSGAGRYGYMLPMRWLAAGDPAAPSGSVYRWLAERDSLSLDAPDLGARVARVGPGTGGDPAFSSIDPELSRPFMDEFVLGVEGTLGGNTRIRFSGIGRRERQHAGIVNTGIPASAFSVTTVLDNGQGETEQQLPAYSQAPETFGDDRYALTNPAEADGTFLGLDLTFQRSTERLTLLAGATAGQFEGYPAYRGFTLIENDRGLLGETFSNPNAATHALGRQFTERAYTLKISGVYRFPRETRLGVIARYLDGQPFARYVVFNELNQGPEPVRAFFNGGTRFTFIMTFDARLQKSIRVGGRRLDLVLDAYNFIHRQEEVEESQVDGPTWRAVTAVVPPLSIHAGVRFVF